MILTISHRTTYRYRRPVELQPHRMMLCPRGQHDVKLLTTLLSCSPSALIEWTQDVFGNLVATASFIKPVDTLIIDSRVVVEQSATAWPIFKIAPSAHSFPFSYSPEDETDLGPFRTPEHADNEGILAAWVRPLRSEGPIDTLTLLKDINTAVLKGISYRERDEEGTQTPLETLSNASGSCRDLATLFIEAVRSLGFGARAVSGYAYDPSGSSGEILGHGATHAWAEVYLPCAGWVAFDPTSSQMGGANLVPVAIARNTGQIKPVEGHYTGTPEDFVEMAVEVIITPGNALPTASEGKA